MRRTESQWPVHQINWQKSRYVYDMFYVYHRISREVYEYCIKNKIVDAALIAKWKKPGYERLCSTYVINPRNYKFGTVSICRVPKHCLAPGTVIEDAVTGCHGCASGPGGDKNIFGNKYGQYLAAIQIAREARQGKESIADEEIGSDSDGKDDESSSDDGPVGAQDGSSGKKSSVWATEGEEDAELLPVEAIGTLTSEADREGRSALRSNYRDSDETSSTKKQRLG
jgi:bud site selection protein 31